MAQAVQAAQAQANQNRVPLVIAVTETHDAAQALARESGILNGNSVVLSVPRTAAQDLNFLNQVASSNLVPRVHVFPPSENSNRMQPQNIQQDIQQYAPFWVRLAGEINGSQSTNNEVASVTQSFGAAANAWNQAQANRPAASNNNNNNSNNKADSPTRQDAAPTPNPTTSSSKPATTASSTNNNNASDAAEPTPVIRVIPKVHIRLHPSAPSSAKLPYVAPQPRNTSLPTIRKAIARAAESTFGDNFLFAQGNSQVFLKVHDEGALITQDIAQGADVFVLPIPATTTTAAPVRQDAAPAATATATATTQNTTSNRPAASASSRSNLRLRIKITFPDGTSEVVSDLNPSSKATELRDKIRPKMSSDNFFIQLPQSRIKDDELEKTLDELGMRGGVALRVIDLDALKQQREEFDQKGQQEQQQESSSMLSSLMNRFRGSGGDSGPSAADPDAAEDTATKPKTGGGPRSMAEIRRQQEEEAEKRKKDAEKAGKGANEFYGGSGTNTQAPPPPDDRPK